MDNVTGSVRLKVRMVARDDIARKRRLRTGEQDQVELAKRNLFSPVVRKEAIRIFFAIAAQMDWKIRQGDVKTAFLFSRSNEKVQVELPNGHKHKKGRDYIWEGYAGLYGMDEASQLWNKTLDEFLEGYGFKACPVEPCLYILKDQKETIILIIYVDDFGYMGNSDKMLEKFEQAIGKRFDIKLTKNPKTFVGFEMEQEPGKIFVHQKSYIEKMAHTFELTNAKVQSTPMEPKLIIQPPAEEMKDIRLYQAMVGSIMYANGTTRPEVSFVTNQLARHASKPGKEHLTYAKKAIKYLYDTRTMGLLYKGTVKLTLKGAVDSEYAGDKFDRKSVTGWLISLNGTPVMWQTKKHPIVTMSSTESEYVGYTMIAKNIAWIRNVLSFLDIDMSQPTKVRVDNQGAMKIAETPKQHGRTKHIDVRYHYIREKINEGMIELEYCSTKDMVADMLTKSLDQKRFIRFRDTIMDGDIKGKCCNEKPCKGCGDDVDPIGYETCDVSCDPSVKGRRMRIQDSDYSQ
jgi:hypothetical protein